jgi:peptide deformylase
METKPLALVGRDHPALHMPARPVEDYEEARRLAGRMWETLRRKQGYAIAAPQVGRALQLVVTPTLWLANPMLLEVGAETETTIEGCLSLPGRWYSVARAKRAVVKGYDLVNGANVTRSTAGVDARMWQHECDHLEGLLLEGRFHQVRHPERVGR